MSYIVIDENGNDISAKVRVMNDSNEDYMNCRRNADKTLDKADAFWDNEIQPLFLKMRDSSMDDFGEQFDPNRADKWSAYMKELTEEIDEKKRQWSAMMDIAGDWEDREFAARFKPLVNFLSHDAENPLVEKEFRLDMMKRYVTHMGVPNLGNYLL